MITNIMGKFRLYRRGKNDRSWGLTECGNDNRVDGLGGLASGLYKNETHERREIFGREGAVETLWGVLNVNGLRDLPGR